MKNILFIALALCVSLGYAQTEDTWEGLSLADYPFIEANFVKATRYSYQRNKIIIHISGGKGIEGTPEPYTAREYGELLYEAFKDSKYTNYPTDIVVFYQDKNSKRETKATVVICGKEFKTKSGKSIFSPAAIGNNIDVFTKAYSQTKCLSSLKATEKRAGF